MTCRTPTLYLPLPRASGIALALQSIGLAGGARELLESFIPVLRTAAMCFRSLSTLFSTIHDALSLYFSLLSLSFRVALDIRVTFSSLSVRARACTRAPRTLADANKIRARAF